MDIPGGWRGGPGTYSLGTLCQLGGRGAGFWSRLPVSAYSHGQRLRVREYTPEPARSSSPSAGSRRLYARSVEQAAGMQCGVRLAHMMHL